MGCGGVYSSNDITIMAVSPARYREWPCGTRVQVCGPAGCIVVTRQDACPGCYANLVDLSEAGNAAVCGSPPHTCRVTLQLVGGRRTEVREQRTARQVHRIPFSDVGEG